MDFNVIKRGKHTAKGHIEDSVHSTHSEGGGGGGGGGGEADWTINKVETGNKIEWCNVGLK